MEFTTDRGSPLTPLTSAHILISNPDTTTFDDTSDSMMVAQAEIQWLRDRLHYLYARVANHRKCVPVICNTCMQHIPEHTNLFCPHEPPDSKHVSSAPSQ